MNSKDIKFVSLNSKIIRWFWRLIWFFLFKPTPRNFHFWRCFLVKVFGAKLGKGVHLYPTVQIWAPWNLEMGDFSCLGDNVDCYSVDKILIGKNTTISQYTFLCTASHDYHYSSMPLVSSPIIIGDNVWIAADVFVAPGVNILDCAVITARSTVLSDISSLSIYSGNPATFSKKRKFINDK
jgi:putative colanic acid biosynthesis acetyltransferase WcaF